MIIIKNKIKKKIKIKIKKNATFSLLFITNKCLEIGVYRI